MKQLFQNWETHFQSRHRNITATLLWQIALCLWLCLATTPAAGAGIFVNTGSMNAGRYYHTATLLPNGKVLVVGGMNVDPITQTGGSTALTSAELYDPATGTWTLTGAMSTGRVFHTTTLLPSGKVLVAGGNNANGYPADAELYDPATETWTLTGSMNAPRGEHTATLLPSGKVLVSGGRNPTSGFLSSAELYDPATQAWNETGELNGTRFRHTATLLTNGQVLVAGGIVSGAYNPDTELYDPNTEMWVASGALNPGRDWHTATLLPNGRVLVAGGENGSSGFSSADLFNPATGTWMPTGLMNVARSQYAATLLPNGKVLVTGSDLNPNSLLSSGELYDPSTETWSTPVPMKSFRFLHTATLLPNSKVLIAGGQHYTFGHLGGIIYVSGGEPLFTTELYEPTPIAFTNTTLTNNTIQLSFTNDARGSFEVLATTNLSLPASNWTTLGNASEISPSQFQFTDLQATNFTQRFYRVRSQ